MRPYPWYYAVNDRPVQLVLTPTGGLDALVVDWESGAFVPDRSYFAKVSETGVGKDVDQLTEEEFARAVVDVRRGIVARHVATPLPWRATGDGEFPYRAEVNGHVYLIRVNDFPAEPIYTLVADHDELADLDDWPAAWTRPPAWTRPSAWTRPPA